MLTVGSLFTGYDGLGLGLAEILDTRPLWFSEIDPAPSRILAHRWPDVPNLGDVTALDWDTVERPDVMTGGFPCQDVSHAGRQAGLGPETRSGLWAHMAVGIERLRPSLVVLENVRGLLSAQAPSDLEPCPWCMGDGSTGHMRALGAVLGDLADIGYDAQWCCVRASDVGAAHGRLRIFVLGWPRATAYTQGGPIRPRLRAAGSDAQRGGRPDNGPDRPTPDADGPGPQGPQPTARPDDAPGRVGDPAPDEWGEFAAAVERWAAVLGRPAPPALEQGPKGGTNASPRFVEWLMGLPEGHVTDVPDVSRPAQMKALGNGVCPQQAAAAVAYLLTDTLTDREGLRRGDRVRVNGGRPAAVTDVMEQLTIDGGGVLVAHVEGEGWHPVADMTRASA